MIKVAIADAHPVLPDGVRTALESTNDFEVVGEAGDGSSSTRALALPTDARDTWTANASSECIAGRNGHKESSHVA